MPIRFACAQCDARVKTPDGSEGKKMKCPRCGHLQRVPEKGAAAIIEDPPSETVEEATPAPPAATPQAEPAAAQPSPPPPEASSPPEDVEPAGEVETNAASDDALAGLAAAGSGGVEANDDNDSHGDDSAPETESSAETMPPGQPAAATPKPRPRPTPQPVPNGNETPPPQAPRSIPLSAHRPRPMPQPRPAGTADDASPGSALSAQVVSPDPAAASEARARSLDVNTGDLPRARTRREIARIRAQLQVLVWLCRGIAVVIAAGAVELMLHAGRHNASVLTQVIFLAAGLAVAGLAVAVGQIAAKVRQTLTGS